MKYLISDTDRHGNERIYVRRPGASKIRITSARGTAAFDAECLRAIRGETQPVERKVRAPSERALPKGHIYFVKAGEHVKIGFSVDVRSRMRSMQTASSRPMVLLLVLAGTQKDERALHARFADLRGNGEWFTAGPDLLEFIRENRKAQNWAPLPTKAKSRTKVSHLV